MDDLEARDALNPDSSIIDTGDFHILVDVCTYLENAAVVGWIGKDVCTEKQDCQHTLL